MAAADAPEALVVAGPPEAFVVADAPEALVVASQPEACVVADLAGASSATHAPEAFVVTHSTEPTVVAEVPEAFVVADVPGAFVVAHTPEPSAVAEVPEAFIVAHSQDRLAAALVGALVRAGRPARLLDIVAAAQALTITVSDQGTGVRPAVPMVLRCPVLPDTEDADARFLFGESLAALWAAAALTRAPVLGRPGTLGFGGACATSAVVTERRGGVFQGREEVFLNGAVRHQTGPEWWLQDQRSLAVVSAGQNAAYPGPQRGRPLHTDEEYELVVVLGAQVWRRTAIEIPGVDLAEKSSTLVRRLGLDFAMVVWAVSADRALLGLARVTPWPALEDIGFAWDAIVPAIIGYLWHDHGHRPG